MKHFKIHNLYKEVEKEAKKSRFIEIETQYKYKLDKYLKHKLDIIVQDLFDNDDGLIIIFGPEGAGKTYFGSQIADYLSKKLKKPLTIHDIHFEGQSYIDKSLSSDNYNINFLDESRRALNKMRAVSSSNVDFMNFLSECRSQNQVHIILLPAYADLEQYVAIHRVKLLLSVEKDREKDTGKLIRGNFNIWTTKYKWLLKKAWDEKYKEPPSKMLIYKGKFENVLCFNKKDYENKKELAKKERYMSKEDKKKKK